MKQRSKFYTSLFLTVFLFSVISPVALFAEEPMRMVYFETFAPFSWRTDDNVMHGILIDVMDEAAKRVGVTLVHEGYPWARAQQMVRDGDADAFVTVATPARREYTEVVDEPVIVSPMMPYTYVGHEKMDEFGKATSLQDFKEYSILDYIGNGWGDANLEGFDRHQAPRLTNVLQMLAGERGDLCFTDAFVAAYMLKDMGLEGQIVQIPLVLDDVSFSLCIDKNSPYVNRLADFNAALKELRESGEMEKIYDKYR